MKKLWFLVSLFSASLAYANGPVFQSINSYESSPTVESAPQIFKTLENLSSKVATPFSNPVRDVETGSVEKQLSGQSGVIQNEYCESIYSNTVDQPDSVDTMMMLPNTMVSLKRSGLAQGGEDFTNFSVLLRMSQTTRDVVSKYCADMNAQECDKKIKLNKDDFMNVCKESFETYFLAEAMDLDSNYQVQINHAEFLGDLGVAAERSAPQGGCNGSKNCYFLSSEEKNSCDPFKCSMVEEESLNSENFGWTKALLLAAPGYEFAAEDKDQCGACFKKQFQVISGKSEAAFENEKNAVKAELEDRLAAKTGAKALLKISAALETAFDLGALYPESASTELEKMCGKELTKVMGKLRKDGCSNTLDTKRVNDRLNKAVASIGFAGVAGGEKLIRKLAAQVDPARESSTCNRADYAKFAQMQYSMLDNQKYAEAFGHLVNLSYDFLDKSCNRHPKMGFVQKYSKSASRVFWNRIQGKAQEALEKGVPAEKFFDALCEGTSGTNLRSLSCGTHQGAGAEVFNDLAQQDKAALESFLKEGGVFDENGKASPESFEKLKKFMTQSFEAKIKSIFKVPMEMNPTLRMALSDWGTLCNARDEYTSKRKQNSKYNLGFSDYVEGISADKETFKARVAQFQRNVCKQSVGKFRDSICYDEGLASENGERNPYSLQDFENAKADLKSDLGSEDANLARGLARNSLSCELRVMAKEPGRFIKKSRTLPAIDGYEPVSSYEQNLAFEQGLGSFNDLGGINFHTFKGCTEDSRDYVERFLSADAGSENQDLKYDPNIMRKKREAHDKVQAYARASKSLNDLFGNEGEDLWGAKSSKGGVIAGRGNKGFVERVRESAKSGIQAPKVSTASSTTAVKEPRFEVSPDRSIESSDDGSRGFAANQPAQNFSIPKNFTLPNPVYRAPASIREVSGKEECDKECLKEMISAQMSSGQADQAANKAGLKNYASSSEDVRSAFEDVLEGKLEQRDLERLRKDNEKLREEIVQIRKQLQNENGKTLKILDAKGKAHKESFPSPATQKGLVFNPRNKSVNEFVDAGYYAGRQAEYSPQFDGNVGAKKISFGNYSSERRAAAAKLGADKVKSFNADIDKSFLRSHENSTVDDKFVQEYVDHVDKNSGSIEHLVIFRNGIPAMIRVPDPSNPGKFVEHPVKGKLAKEILARVEQDEVESYALYSMVSFGQTLSQFMESVQEESTNLTTLASLNQKLESMRSMGE